MKRIPLLTLFLGFLFYSPGTAWASSIPTAAAIDEAFDQDDLTQLQLFIKQLWEQPCPDTSLLLAETLHYYAAWYFIPENEWEEAADYLQKALKIRKENLSANDTDIGRTAYNLGLVKLELGDYEEAINCFQQTEKLFTQVENWTIKIMARRMFAVALEAKGDYERVAEELRFCVDLARKHHLIKQEADVLLDWGMNCNLRKDYVEGARLLQTALDRYEQMDQEEIPYNPVNKGFCYINFAFAYSEQGLFENAISASRSALNWIDQDDLPNRCKVYSNIGYFSLQLEALSEAELALATAEEIARQIENPIYLARVWDNQGELRQRQGHHSQAVDLYTKSIEALLPPLSLGGSIDQRLQEGIYKDELLIFLTDRARCYSGWAEIADEVPHLKQAMEDFRSADQLIDIMRYEQTAQGSKLHWRSITRPVYEDALATCFLLEDTDAAFYFLEKSKSILLLDALTDAQAKSLLPVEWAEKERKLKRGLNDAQLAVLTHSGTEQKQFMDKVVQKRAELDALNKSLEQQFPEYWLSRSALQTITPEQLATTYLEPENASLISFLLGEEYLYRWIQRFDGTTHLERLPRGEVNTWLVPYLEQLSLLRTSFRPQDYAALAYPLYQNLVGEELSGSDRIYIVPDGQLGFVPFEALMKTPDYALDAYLLFDQPVQQVYSASVLNEQLEGRKTGQWMTSFAPTFSNGHRNLPPLENSQMLLNALPQVQQKRFAGPAATLENFQQWSPKSQIINLITHAEAGLHQMPSIEFWDTTLYLPQLYAMDIPADLVILAACETGIGSLTNGEGILSLSQGMTYAGAASLIASLWKVREQSTTEILSSFYAELQSGENKVEALHAAKLNYLANCSEAELNPYFWAALVYYGADGPLQTRSILQLGGLAYGLIALLLLLLVGLIWSISRNNSLPKTDYLSKKHGTTDRSTYYTEGSLELATKRDR
ncbi:MAG: CHAT domain-containing protein [Bacteroidota bacterium]